MKTEPKHAPSSARAIIRRHYERWLSGPWNSLPLQRKASLAVVVPTIALLFGFGVVWFGNYTENQIQEEIDRSLQVRNELQRTLNAVLTAESDIRGFVISGRSALFSDYEVKEQSIPDSLKHLRRLVQDKPSQIARIKALDPLIKERFRLLQSLATTSSDAGFLKSRQTSTAPFSDGMIAMDKLRAKAAEIEKEEIGVQTERTADVEFIREITVAASAATVAVGIIGGMVAIFLLTMGIVQRITRIGQNAVLLADGKALPRTQSARDEIGRLEDRLHAASALLIERESALREEADIIKRADDALRESTRQLEIAAHTNALIMDNSRDVICTIDAGGRFVTVSAASERVWGYKPSDLIGQKSIELVALPDRARTVKTFTDIMNGKIMPNYENRCVREDGSVVNILWSAYWSDADQKMFATAHDVTERARHQSALKQAKEAADRANRGKSEFLSRVSHELRTPLNAILGFGQILEMDQKDPDTQEHVGHIIRAGKHLLNLINEVLDISRIESGRLNIHAEPLSLGPLLKECVDLIQPIAQQRNVKVTGNYENSCAQFVIADRQRLNQVFLNLLSNAVKYNRDGGTVTLSCETNENRVRINFRDTGLGISPEHVSRLFGAFERLDAHRLGVEGTGLGLALSKKLIELMGGNIGVHSELGSGTVFWVEFAVAEESPVSTAAPSPPDQCQDHEHTVLYIEDNLANVHLIEQILEDRPGIKLISAMQGRLGIDLAREHRPDLVLLDLNLPDMPGQEVLSKLRSTPATAGTPVIIISGETAPHQIDTLMTAGASAYITKPFRLKNFLATIDASMSG